MGLVPVFACIAYSSAMKMEAKYLLIFTELHGAIFQKIIFKLHDCYKSGRFTHLLDGVLQSTAT
jgi:hypothetical protein